MLTPYLDQIVNVSCISESLVHEAGANVTRKIYQHDCIQGFIEAKVLDDYIEYDLEIWEKVVYSAAYVIICALAVVGNGLVIFTVVRKSEMRMNKRNVLIVNLALSNLALGLLTIPLSWLPSLALNWTYSVFFCKLANALPGSNVYCSTLTICVMAIDRYYTVKRLALTRNDKGKCPKVALLISLLIWVLAFLLSLPLLFYYDVKVDSLFTNVTVVYPNGYTEIRNYELRKCMLIVENAQVHQPQSTNTTLSLQLSYVSIGVSLLQVSFLYIVPLIVLTLFNLKLTHFLKKNSMHVESTRVKVNSPVTSPMMNFHPQYRSAQLPAISPRALCNESSHTPLVFPPRRPPCTGNSNSSRSSRGNSQLSGTIVEEEDRTLNTPHYTNGTLTATNSNHSGEFSSPENRRPSSMCGTPLVGSAARSSANRRSRTTVMLYMMALTYAVLWLPFTLLTCLLDFNLLTTPDEKVEPSTRLVIRRIDETCKVIAMVSVGVNPFLYGYLNTNFKREFKEILRSCALCGTAGEISRNPSRNTEFSIGGGGTALHNKRLQHLRFASLPSTDSSSFSFTALRRSIRQRIIRQRSDYLQSPEHIDGMPRRKNTDSNMNLPVISVDNSAVLLPSASPTPQASTSHPGSVSGSSNNSLSTNAEAGDHHRTLQHYLLACNGSNHLADVVTTL